MHKVLIFAFSLLSIQLLAQPCTTLDATGCKCEDNSQTNCDLLPDITISGYALANYLGGPVEYGQNGNGVDNGRLRLSGSTPNIGHGPFTVGSVNIWTCGTDTFTSLPANCPNGGDPKQLIQQKIYHKNGNNMSFWTRWAGSMTYHPTHGHMHVDDWATFTLRVEDLNEPDPLKWPIIGDGAKVGFCLMDYGTCSFYNGHCRDSSNNIMLNGDFQNWGLGGGQYNCSPIEQGISVGYTDIYSQYLDGMWIDIPPGTCNGDYFIVLEVDPSNNFLESDETNNWAYIPFVLTKQQAPGQGIAIINPQSPTHVCHGDTILLKANPGSAYLWSNGDTNQTFAATLSGWHTVTVTSPCGTATSDSLWVEFEGQQAPPTTVGDVICEGNTATVHAMGTGSFAWYDSPLGGNFLGTGTTLNTPTLVTSTDYFVEAEKTTPSLTHMAGPTNPSFGSGNHVSLSDQYLVFDALKAFTLKSVWLDANGGAFRSIELRSQNGLIMASSNQYIPDGGGRVTLNFQVPVGFNMQLGASPYPDFYRNNSNVTYPYSQNGIIDIKYSSSGFNNYYYFYDWEIEIPGMTCSSPRVAANVNVINVPQLSFAGLDTAYFENEAAVLLTATPTGGVFSGPGISGNMFDPALAGPGGPYTITYTYAGTNNCPGTTSQNVVVYPYVGLDENPESALIRVFPNPGKENFNLRIDGLPAGKLTLNLYDLRGRILKSESRMLDGDRYQGKIDLNGWPSGIYLLELRLGNTRWMEKVIIQP